MENPFVISRKTILIEECGEEMEVLDSEEFFLEPMYFNWGYCDTPIIRARSKVHEKLRKAQKYLQSLRPGWRLKIWDGFRTTKVQKILFDNYYGILKKEHKDWSHEQLFDAVGVFVSPPSHDETAPSPHNTGGAVDLTLADENGKEVEMGSRFDEFHEKSFTDYYKKFLDDEKDVMTEELPGTEAISLSDAQKFNENRKLLRDVMESEGFVNYAGEWWHFSYGDQFYAYMKGEKVARYGSVELG